MVDIFVVNCDGVVDHGYWCRCYSFYCRCSDLNYQNWCCWTLKISYDVYWLTYVPMLLSIAYILSQRSFRCYFRFPFCLLCAAKYNSAVHGCTNELSMCAWTWACACIRCPSNLYSYQFQCLHKIPLLLLATHIYAIYFIHFNFCLLLLCGFSTIYTFSSFLFISNAICYSI